MDNSAQLEWIAALLNIDRGPKIVWGHSSTDSGSAGRCAGKTLGYAVPVVNEVLLAHIANEKIKVSQSTVLKPTVLVILPTNALATQAKATPCQLQSGGDDVPSPLLVPAASNEVECDPTSAFEEEIDVADPLSPSLVPAALQFNGASAGILNFFAPIPQKKDESRPHGHGDGDLYSASPPRHSSPAETSVFSPVNEGTILSNILKDQSIPSGQNPSCAQGTCAHGACKRHAANTLVLFQGAHLATKELLSSPDANRFKSESTDPLIVAL
ncbi:hypothetical protein BELL_0585g00030 [Botrytis elliptica]|uniref:Uncharacterized protein n=1 Tax=Botrytis elliptica TaxID=278938 RepID=A0A4Z1JDQ7_9HELO|nr:hypothetical protein BELL_0585g00030 [Botrytis elliptica]